MNYNYHTHTYRCGHAIGNDEEYIKRAIDSGIKYMGFSEHAPFKCEDGFEGEHRIPMSKAKEYIESISILRKKYESQIDIKIGFEMEYYPNEFQKMLKTVLDLGAEYLILGQHFLENEHYCTEHTYYITEKIDDLYKYVALIVLAIKSGVFTYVAHPDAISFVGDENLYIDEMRKICIASKEHNIPLEINFCGISENRRYPNNLFWKIVGEVGSPVTFGFDAHSPGRAFDGDSLKTAEKIVQIHKLNYIGKPKIIIL